MNFIILFFPLFFSFCEASPPYGQLSVKDSQLLGSNGQPAQLVGMSLFWSNCDEGKVFYNYDTLKILKCNWNANVVRAAMGVESSGCQRPAYLDVPSTERDKVEAVVKAAIELDMYVIIDFHTNNAPNYLDKAIEFFTYFAKNYGSKYPNILYETFNEALQVDWSGVKAYHEKVVTAIRQYDKNNIIILGTTTWSQDVDIATNNPVAGSNLCYTLHFYAASHKQEIRDKAQTAINNKNCVFVTEYGTVYNSGGGDPDVQSTNEWWSFLDKNKISYLNWALENKGEGSAALLPNTVASLAGDDTHLTASGRMVKTKLRSMNTGVSCSGGSNNGSPSLSDNKNGGTLLTTRVPANNNGIKDGDNKGYPEGKQVNNPVTSKPPSNDNNKGKGYPEGNPKITLTTKLPGKKHGNGEQYPGDNNEPKHPNANSPATLKPKNDEGDDEECVCEDDENPNNGTNSVTKTPENNGGNFPGNNDPINCSIELRDKWTGGANLILNFVNNGNSKACAIKFTLELCPDQTIQSIWNVQKISENTYLLPNYIIIQPKSKYVEAGLVVNGPSTLPKIKFIEQGKCIY